MAASYLVKKSDIYYFRHYIPERIQPILGKKEFVRSLKVTNKSLAVKISREIKILFDSIMDKTQQVPSVTWKEIREAVGRAFDGLYRKYVTNVDTYGPSYRDGYDPLNYIPPEWRLNSVYWSGNALQAELIISRKCELKWRHGTPIEIITRLRLIGSSKQTMRE